MPILAMLARMWLANVLSPCRGFISGSEGGLGSERGFTG